MVGVVGVGGGGCSGPPGAFIGGVGGKSNGLSGAFIVCDCCSGSPGPLIGGGDGGCS